jgi:hypothetical protein
MIRDHRPLSIQQSTISIFRITRSRLSPVDASSGSNVMPISATFACRSGGHAASGALDTHSSSVLYRSSAVVA